MTVTKLMTAEDLYLMGEDEGRFELIEGELREMAPAGEEYGEIGLGIAARIWGHAREHRLGTAYNSATGFILRRDPDLVFAPDASFVRAGRLSVNRDKRKFIEIVPDLVVEVISPSESPGDISNKVARYLDAGVRLVWVVYPENRMIGVYRADRTWETIQLDGTLDGEDVLPGFSLPLSELFDQES